MRSLAWLLLLTCGAYAGDLPNKQLTPGAVTNLSSQYICTHTTGSRRNVTAAMKRSVFARYGIKCSQCGKRWEVDHLVPLALGGDNVIANLWPELWDGPRGAHVKDRLEVHLQALVCHKQLSLRAAQTCIRSNWIACYQRWKP